MFQRQNMPWTVMFRHAVLLYHISPTEFWHMTMKEFMYLVDCNDTTNLITKSELDYMIKNFK